MSKWPIGVFASIDAGLGVKLEVAKDLNVPTIQLHAPEKATRTDATCSPLSGSPARARDSPDRGVCWFRRGKLCRHPHHPAHHRPRAGRNADVRTAEMKEIADFAHRLNCDVVALHLGFIPHASVGDPAYDSILDVTRDMCDHCAALGQESAPRDRARKPPMVCYSSLPTCSRDNLFVNFDPANMILYGTGEPIEALKKIGRYVRSVHCKDALWSDQPGVTWGQEVPLGQGQVNIEAYLRTLQEIGYDGPLTIEREIPQEPARQKAEIGGAVELLERLKRVILT